MTCREFKHNAEALTLWELSRGPDEAITSHARQCASCGSWWQQQRTLASSLQALQTRTSSLEAGANVEQAVLRAFRQNRVQGGAVAESAATAGVAAVADAAPAAVKNNIVPVRPMAAPVSAPFALRMSRWFEIGAYVAAAAAVMVGMFLGIRLVEHRSNSVPAQAKSTPAQPAVQKTEVVATETEPPQLADVTTNKRTSIAGAGELQAPHGRRATAASQPATTEELQSDSDAGYVALMICDPLSCAADSQVVRMELPSPGSGSQSSQPQVADVVVGYDGVVRAVRMVN